MYVARLSVPFIVFLALTALPWVASAKSTLSTQAAKSSASTNDDDLLDDDNLTIQHNVPDDAGPSGIYVQGSVGYALTYISDRIGSFTGATWKRHAGGVMGGGDIGYQFNNIFAIEAGGFYLPTSELNFTSPLSTSKFETWAAYIAGKMRVYLYENTHLFAKAGLSYQRTTLTGTRITSPNPKKSHYGVLLGFGTEYNFTPAFSLSVEYLRLPGRTSDTAVLTPPTTDSIVPDSNIMLATIGYMFGQGDKNLEGRE